MNVNKGDIFSVEGKCVAITGGTGVLGSAMVAGLARRGAKICVIGHNIERANKVAGTISDEGGFAIPLQANVLDRQELSEAMNSAIRSLGHIDVLINAAGGNRKEAACTPPQTFFDLDAEAMRWVMDLNCLGTMLPAQVFGRHMAERGEGVIINISSMNAFRPLTRIAAYSAAKAAVSNFTQWLAAYMCRNHSPRIRVNAIAPGFFLTEQNNFLLMQENGRLSERGRQILDHTPMGRFGNPDDLIGTLIWLVSDAAKFVTGIVVPVDGGFSAYSGV